ncbi:MAG: electron transport complex subunit RsxG [Candidatus Accumulibacter sp.]|jgi:electron transport complex protein RnfG|nr:electron transport complex subunit RsxG [Accumulibacter sp.]
MTPPARKPMTAVRMAARTALILFLFVVVFTALLAGVYLWTLPSIEAAATGEKMKLIDEVLPRERYDNDLFADAVSFDAAPGIGPGVGEPARILRARKGGRIEALLIEAVAHDGYAGDIRLLLALDAEGRIIGVRVVAHKETPGLGDYIDARKDPDKARPWITQFDGLNPAAASAREWKVKKDGGRFDSMAGATVSPRAVIKAVREAALFVAANREKIMASR